MKSTLLTTTALIAFAGAAAAEVTFSGSATLGYNDTTNTALSFTGTTTNWTGTSTWTTTGDVLDDNNSFYWDANIAVTLTEELDNGLTVGASFDFDFADMNNGSALEAGSYVLSLTSDSAGLYYGDTAFAAETRWVGAGDMEADGFSEADGETVLRGDFEVAMVAASLSMVIADTDANTAYDVTGGAEDYDQVSFGLAADFGQFSGTVAYQEESAVNAFTGYSTGNGDYNGSEIFGLSVSAAFSGADITVAYASNETAGESSTGVQVSYPFGPVTATAYYVSEDDGGSEDNYGVTVAYADGPIAVTLDYDYDQGVQKVGLDGSYDMGNGFVVLAGMYDQSDDAGFTAGYSNEGTDYYVAGTYDLGGGASVLVSYAEAETGGAIADDEVGGNDYQDGTTVEVNFTF